METERRGEILPIDAAAVPAILSLNNQNAAELSWLDVDRLQAMLAQAFYARRIGDLDAFLLAFDENATYDSPNFLWFRQHYRRFVYVDRVAVAPAARARGYARQLYADLFHCAARAGHNLIACEVNIDPPNPISDKLHAALGFTEVDRAAIHGGSQIVRYLIRAIAPPSPERLSS